VKHILVAVDGSEHSLAAVDLAADIAERFGSKITFVHVIPQPALPAGPNLPPPPYPDEFLAYMRKVGEEVLEAAHKRIARRKVEVQRTLVEGVPTPQIVKVADDLDVDLIVMGSRGLGPIKGLVMGSVSTRVLFQTSRSVLIVK
jgi:nucleotide-binding universal stress UspA family protein